MLYIQKFVGHFRSLASLQEIIMFDPSFIRKKYIELKSRLPVKTPLLDIFNLQFRQFSTFWIFKLHTEKQLEWLPCICPWFPVDFAIINQGSYPISFWPRDQLEATYIKCPPTCNVSGYSRKTYSWIIGINFPKFPDQMSCSLLVKQVTLSTWIRWELSWMVHINLRQNELLRRLKKMYHVIFAQSGLARDTVITLKMRRKNRCEQPQRRRRQRDTVIGDCLVSKCGDQYK